MNITEYKAFFTTCDLCEDTGQVSEATIRDSGYSTAEEYFLDNGWSTIDIGDRVGTVCPTCSKLVKFIKECEDKK